MIHTGIRCHWGCIQCHLYTKCDFTLPNLHYS